MMKSMRCIALLLCFFIFSGCSDNPNILQLNKVTELSISSRSSTVMVGLSIQYDARTFRADGTSSDVTKDANFSWSSSDNDIVTVNSEGVATGVSVGVAAITVTGTVDGKTFTASKDLTVTDVAVESLVITPATSELPAGLSHDFIATAYFSDGSSLDVTRDPVVSWHSDNESVATISNLNGEKGRVHAQAVGDAMITATGVANGETFTATSSLKVTNTIVESLVVTPAIKSLPVGLSYDFIATAYFSDGKALDVTHDPALTWLSDNESVAMVTNNDAQKGKVTPQTVGDVTITATGSANGKTFTASSDLTVTAAIVESLVVTPKITTLPKGLSHKFVATAYFSDGSALDVTQDPAISWHSGDESVATISNIDGQKGELKAQSIGDVVISATGVANGKRFTADSNLKVSAATVESLVVTPTLDVLPAGLSHNFVATAYFSDGSTLDVSKDPAITWYSDDEAIASVSNINDEKGMVTSQAVGSTVITAQGTANDQLFTASSSIEVTAAMVESLVVTPVISDLAMGLTHNFVATAYFTDGSALNVTNEPVVTWHSDNASIAHVSTMGEQKGTVKAQTVGKATITATGFVNDEVFSASAELNVTEKVITGIDVYSKDVIDEPIAAGLTRDMVAIATFSDGSTSDITDDPSLVWRSEDNEIATVTTMLASGNGIVKGVSSGEVDIVVTKQTNDSALVAKNRVIISDAIITKLAITPQQRDIPAGIDSKLEAVISLSDGSTTIVTDHPDLSWQSNDTSIATVKSGLVYGNGMIKGVGIGSTSIVATAVVDGTIFSAEADITVINAVVTDLQVSPSTLLIPVGEEGEFTATAIFSDGSSLNVTNDPALTWRSDDTKVATVSTGLQSGDGIAMGVSVGNTVITASGVANGTSFSASSTLEVAEDPLLSLTIEGATGIPVYYDLGSLEESYTVKATYKNLGAAEYDGVLDWEFEVSQSGLATFDSASRTITSFPRSPEVSGRAILTACAMQGKICDSIEVVLFTQFIQILESETGGTDKSCEDLGYQSINEQSFLYIFNSEYRPEAVDRWRYLTNSWTYSSGETMRANIYGRVLPYSGRHNTKVAYISQGATNEMKVYETDTYSIINTAYGFAHLICSLD